MAYQVDLTTSAYDEFATLPRVIRDRVASVLLALASEPRPHRCAVLASRPQTCRVALGDYRILYDLYDKTRRIVVVAILGGEYEP